MMKKVGWVIDGGSFCAIFRLFKYEEVDVYASEVWDSDTT